MADDTPSALGAGRRSRSVVQIGLAVAAVAASLLGVPAAPTPAQAQTASDQDVSDVAAGGRHSCAVASGQVWCWGDGDRGQLGQGLFDDAGSPTRAGSLTGIVDVVAGGAHTCARTREQPHQLWCWGANNAGQLGDGTTTDSAVPVRVDLPGSVEDVDAGRAHTCAVVRSASTGALSVWCWGSNSHGQLGTADIADLELPAACTDLKATSACRSALATRRLDVGPDGSLWVVAPGARAGQPGSLLRYDVSGRLIARYSTGQQLDGPLGATSYGTGFDVGPLLRGKPAALAGAADLSPILVRDLGDPTVPGSSSPEVLGPLAWLDAEVAGGCRVRGLAAATGSRLSAALQCPDGGRVVAESAWTTEGRESFSAVGDMTITSTSSRDRIRVAGRQPESGQTDLVVTLSAIDGTVLRRDAVPGTSGACAVTPGATRVVAGIGAAGNGYAVTSYEVDPASNSITWSCLETRSATSALAASFGQQPEAPAGFPGLYTDVAGHPDGDLIAYDALHGRIVKVSPDGAERPLWGRTVFLSSPRQVPVPTGQAWTSLTLGRDSSCALAGADAWCWGDNGSRQLGVTPPPPVVTLSDAPIGSKFLSPGSPAFAAVETDGGGRAGVSRSVTVPSLSAKVATLAPSPWWRGTGTPSYVRTRSDVDPDLAEWDRSQWFTVQRQPEERPDPEMDVRRGTPTAEALTPPVALVPERVEIDFGLLAAGSTHVCATGPSGGSPGPDAVLCQGDVAIDAQPLVAAGTDIVQLTGGSGFFCARTSSNAVTCRDAGQATWPSGGTDPLQVPDGARLVAVDVDAGSRHACAVGAGTEGPSAFCWGDNDAQQVAPGDTASFTRAQVVPIQTTSIVTLSLTDPIGVAGVDQHGPLVVRSDRSLAGIGPGTLRIRRASDSSLVNVAFPFDCRDVTGAPVDCGSGPVRQVWLTPSSPLTAGALVATINTGGVTSFATSEGRPVQPVTSSSATVRVGPTVALTLGDLDGESQVPAVGPLVVSFSRSVGRLNESSLRLRVAGTGGAEVPFELRECRNSDGQSIDCRGGTISSAILLPDSPLDPRLLYQVTLNLLPGHGLPQAAFVPDVGAPAALAVGEGIFWADRAGDRIGRASLDGGEVERGLVVGLQEPRGIAVDDVHVYWSASDGTIGRAGLDGSDVEENFLTGLTSPGAIAVSDSWVYWTSPGRIGRAALDGSSLSPTWRAMQDAATVPTGVTVDDGIVVWTDGSSIVSDLEVDDAVAPARAGVSGLPTGVEAPFGAALWADRTNGWLARLGAGGTEDMVRGLDAPVDVAVTPRWTYWADADGIGRTGAFGSGVTVVTGGSAVPAAVSAAVGVGPLRQVTPTISTSNGTIEAEDPVEVAFDVAVAGVTDAALVLVRVDDDTVVRAAVLECRGPGGVVDCATGPVTSTTIGPESALEPGVGYAVVVNDGYSAVPLMTVEGVPAATARSAAVPVRVPGCSGASCITVSALGGGDTLTIDAAVLVVPDSPVAGVSAEAVVLRDETTGEDVPSVLSCVAPGGAEVSCDSASVESVTVQPDVLLVPGRGYVVVVNPDGAAPVTLDDVPLPTSTSQLLTVAGAIADDSPALDYRWGELVSSTGAVGGRILREDRRGASLRYDFTGTRIRWITSTGPKQGWATVRIDGRLVDEINTWSTEPDNRVGFTFGDLPEGPHRITITVQGRLGAPKGGRSVVVDAFRVASSVTGTTLDPNPRPPARWGRATSAPAIDDRVSVSGTPGATATVTFDGTTARVALLRGVGQGRVELLVDGRREALVELGDSRAVRLTTLTVADLDPGPHTLVVRVKRGPVALDGIDVLGS